MYNENDFCSTKKYFCANMVFSAKKYLLYKNDFLHFCFAQKSLFWPKIRIRARHCNFNVSKNKKIIKKEKKN